MKSIHQAILSTIIYADIFDYPLTGAEIWRYFIGKKTNYQTFQRALTVLTTAKQIMQIQEYYVLPKRTILSAIRQERAKYTKEKRARALKIARLLGLIPTVLFVGISGALAMNNTPHDDDIDFFIITAPHTLWLTRLVVTLVLDVLGVRRQPASSNVSNKICINMFLDGSKLKFASSEQDLYLAHEISQLKPLVNKAHIYERFLHVNKWVRTFLPHMPFPKEIAAKKNSIPVWLVKLNTISFNFQTWYMRKRRTSEIIKQHILKLHPNDARVWVRKAYTERAKKYHVPVI